jgi:polyphosphate kinase
VRLTEAEHLREIDEIFDLAMSPTTAAWTLDGYGEWHRHHLADDGSPLQDMQNVLQRQISSRKRPGSGR